MEGVISMTELLTKAHEYPIAAIISIVYLIYNLFSVIGSIRDKDLEGFIVFMGFIIFAPYAIEFLFFLSSTKLCIATVLFLNSSCVSSFCFKKLLGQIILSTYL